MENHDNMIGYGDATIIFDDVANLISDAMKKESAADTSKRFNRDRKAVYCLRDGCGFRCDADFVNGVRSLGYDLRLVKTVNGADTGIKDSAGRITRKKCVEVLELAEKDMIATRDIVSMRDMFEASTNDLSQICYTMELLLSCLHEQEEESPHREALTLLWRNLLSVRERMSAACMDGSTWSAAIKAQSRLNSLSAILI